MFVDSYYRQEGNRIAFTREQASAFAKGVADDFNPLHDVDEDLRRLRPEIEQAFLHFYPQLNRHVREWRMTTGDRIVAADN